MAGELEWLLKDFGSTAPVVALAALGERLAAKGELHLAATVLDRACGRSPKDEWVKIARGRLLDRLAVEREGMMFRYVPAGIFLMGSGKGDADERPVHAVQVDRFWISETPVSWGWYCRVMGWEPPPTGLPSEPGKAQGKEPEEWVWRVYHGNKMRLQYCENETVRAGDWHRHHPNQHWQDGKGKVTTSQKMFGEPPRSRREREWGYEEKAMVCVGWEEAERFCGKGQVRLPTEAEWEKAARGGLVGARYPWGDAMPSEERCDFGRFEHFALRPMKQYAPNGYGLYAMSGGVWEWTADWYDAEYYKESAGSNPRGPTEGKQRVLRGGSWADCAEAVTVSFRMSLGGEGGSGVMNPNVGFRVCLV